jgi:uncharacterized Zn-binding protein involved in type VI secretion
MNLSKVGDIGEGVCPNHKSAQAYTTVFQTGAPSVLINGQPAATVETVGIATCGHPTVALTGSATVFIEGKPAHRVGDTGANYGPYTAVSGSGNVILG